MSGLALQVLAAATDAPWNVAIPAVTALGAYLNARFNVAADLRSLHRVISYDRKCKSLEAKDRVNMFYLVEELAQDPQSANRPFLVLPLDTVKPGERSQWTYAEAYENILQWAGWLKQKHRIQRDEIVALDCPNKPKFIWIWYAIWSLGAKPAFLNTNLRSNAFVHCVRTSTARLLLLDSDLEDALNDETLARLAATGTGRAVDVDLLTDETDSEISKRSIYRAPDEVRSGTKVSSPAILIYTSGTTGLPKAAYVDWRKPLSGLSIWCQALGLGPTDRFFTAMPLYHSSASVLGVGSVIGAGCTLVLAPKFSPHTFMRYASETDATVVQYIGEMCRYLLSAPVSSADKNHRIRAAFGNGLRPDVWQTFKDRFNIATILEFYGATEGPGASVNLSHNAFSRGAIGKSGKLLHLLMSRTQALVRHDVESDAPLRDPMTNFCSRASPNEPGELIHQLDPEAFGEKFQGYHGNEKATSSKILRDVFKQGDAWYRTGDLMRRDADGLLWFVDRIGDTFRWKGENVSTAEVSEALGSHGSLREANAYGVQLPGHDGRAGCAAVVLHDGQALDDALKRSLAAHVRQRLPRYAVPLFLRLVKEFEVTGTMKQTKVGLRNEGVDPSKMGEDELYWLPPTSDSYQRFREKEWKELTGGKVKL
ncbi:acetyl-CoA synthetase-like protein [Polychaeton citri CBS 116435]|uniref:Very long-chain fatty acid transport protein n=1 Tax=Polychaeton citri CBS 116435 TaxID=1314669 RepID=A0A9P4UMU9_9PEZI|nr:acetyl-CoA synthetase-like protein [Polychaeton citri CBS 116435]